MPIQMSWLSKVGFAVYTIAVISVTAVGLAWATVLPSIGVLWFLGYLK